MVIPVISKTVFRKYVIVVALILLTMVSTLNGRGKARPLSQFAGFQTHTSSASDDIFQQIRQQVTAMEYPAATADNLVSMVSRWKTPRGQSVLPILQRILFRSQEACKEGHISRTQLAQTEEKVVAGLCQSIKSEIAYKRNYFDLETIIGYRHANCFGYAQLLCILGNSIGLTVSAMNVSSEHVANIVELSDGTMTVVDLIRSNNFLSERIITDSEFEGEGSRWTYKDKNHITQENKTIHILDHNELIGEIYFCRGTMQYMSGRGAEAIEHYDKAIERRPQCARAYNNRGGARLILSDHADAIADFNKAIELDPTYVSAYHNRANAYLDTEEYAKAIVDYTRAIELNPQFAKAYFGRGFAHLSLGHYDEAINDYTQAIQLNPTYARAYYTRAIGYAQLGERAEAVHDMMQAITLDQTLRNDVEKLCAEFDLNLKLN
ncbi:MAG: tetratricopeptide repeat protein [Sedimentisphaerales bacterium]|nr:tetratricopeptide repeat protein [Sedimentisphaerales bacterium]